MVRGECGGGGEAGRGGAASAGPGASPLEALRVPAELSARVPAEQRGRGVMTYGCW